MKSILLASASIVGFAGAAAAEISFGGSATLGFNDTDAASTTDEDYGFFWDANVAVTMSTTLDNGLTASATFDFDVADNNLGQDLISGGYVLSLTHEMGSLYFGDTGTAQDKHWAAAGEMDADDFSANDGGTVLRGDVMFGGVDVSVSYFVDDAADELVQLGLGASGSFGTFNYALAYQEEAGACAACGGDYDGDQVFGLSVGTSFAGADLTVAYAQNSTEDASSIGVAIAYPFGPVTVGAYYVMEDPADDSFGVSLGYASGAIAVDVMYEEVTGGDADWAIEGSYDLGNGLVAYAGVADAGEDFYVAGSFDLGSGANLLVSYAEDGDSDAEDEIGAPEYKEGATVQVSFEF